MAQSANADLEALLAKVPAGNKLELRLWLRMLSCVNFISAEIRRKLRAEFGVTLPQFDVLAQLQREQDGLRLGELSRRLMVTNGNLTGLVDKLVEAGFVVREGVPGDRRVQIVRMTKAGATLFSHMARSHETWLSDMLSDVKDETMSALIRELELVKRSVTRRAANDG